MSAPHNTQPGAGSHGAPEDHSTPETHTVPATDLDLATLPGIDPAWSRFVEAVDADGITRRWHVLEKPA